MTRSFFEAFSLSQDPVSYRNILPLAPISLLIATLIFCRNQVLLNLHCFLSRHMTNLLRCILGFYLVDLAHPHSGRDLKTTGLLNPLSRPQSLSRPSCLGHIFLVLYCICQFCCKNLQNINWVRFPYFCIKFSNYLRTTGQKNGLKIDEFSTHQRSE